MRKIIFVPFFLLMMVFVSCQKDKEEQVITQDPVPTPNYYPLTIGNYWVYENYKVENHQETLLAEIDSLMVTKDTLIRNEMYFIIDGISKFQFTAKKVLRDSSGYLIDIAGNIMFTYLQTDEVYFSKTQYDDDGDTIYNMQYHTALANETIPVDIVTFPENDLNVLNRITDFITFPNNNGPDTLKYRSVNSYFIDGIGQASDAVFYASAPFHYEKRLIRYHINTFEHK